MRYLSKFVAAVLAIVLWTLPLSASTACSSSTESAGHCKQCCHGIAMAAMASSGAMNQSEASPPSCCRPSSDQHAVLPIAREAQNSAVVSQVSISAFEAVVPSAPSGDIRPMPDRSMSSRLQSVLCTFLI